MSAPESLRALAAALVTDLEAEANEWEALARTHVPRLRTDGAVALVALLNTAQARRGLAALIRDTLEKAGPDEAT